MFHKSKLALGISSLKNNQLILKDYIQSYPDSPVLSAAINHLLNYYNTNSMINEELNLYNKYITKFNNDPWFLNQYAWRMTEIEMNLDTALEKINLSGHIVLCGWNTNAQNIISNLIEHNKNLNFVLINEELESEMNNVLFLTPPHLASLFSEENVLVVGIQ